MAGERGVHRRGAGGTRRAEGEARPERAGDGLRGPGGDVGRGGHVAVREWTGRPADVSGRVEEAIFRVSGEGNREFRKGVYF